jgi:3-methyladenine DNA glycosylase AlkC
MEPLKEMFNRPFYEKLASEFLKAFPPFHLEKFVKEVTNDSADLSLNQRMRNTSVVLQKHLPDYKRSIDIMMDVIPNMGKGYTSLLFPDYVGLFGLDHFSLSMDALKFFTTFGSSEFAVREFLKRDTRRTLSEMYRWSGDENFHVRRLASEGSRPRLPWSFKLDAIIANPSLTKSILENLKADPELYVRKSVANHINDISKDSSEYVHSLVKTWDKTNPHTAWVVKHGCRSMLKNGDSKTLKLFNLTGNFKVKVRNFRLLKNEIRLNEDLVFKFSLVSEASSAQKLVVHYRIHYVKKTGQRLPKIFKLKEITLKPSERIQLSRKQRFQDFTTRQHFPGVHVIDILVNGETVHSKKFSFER